MSLNECLNRWRTCDEARDSLPGEHALVAAAGGVLIVSALFAPSALRSTLRAMLGGALLVRAASGREGIGRWMQAPAPAAARQPWQFPTSESAGGQTVEPSPPGHEMPLQPNT